jgi:hypothetical protein
MPAKKGKVLCSRGMSKTGVLDEDARREFIDCTLCSQVDPADRSLVHVAPPPASVAAFFDASIADGDEDMKEESTQPVVPAIPAIPVGTEKERLFVQTALPVLSMQRRIDRTSWMTVGFAISTVFGKDQMGKGLFRL